ncbi:MAG: hypothetical protein M1840_008314 [Geoglossum simile]|nr:MAG: hypothetical protein M1840_008314 [Geoglossum simile]
MPEEQRLRTFLDHFQPFRTLHNNIKDALEEMRLVFGTESKNMTLDENIWLIQRVLRAERDFVKRRLYLNGLAAAFHLRYMKTKQEADIDQWIQYAQQLLEVSHGTEDQKCALEYLVEAFKFRFEDTKAKVDIDQTIKYTQQTLEISDSTDKEKTLESLATHLLNRYLKFHQMTDLENSIHYSQQLLQDSQSTTHIPAFCCNLLCRSLRERFLKLDQLQDLKLSVLYGQQAVDAVPAGDPNEKAYSVNLYESLRRRLEISHQPSDLEASIQCVQRIVDSKASGSSREAQAQLDLIQRLTVDFKRKTEGRIPNHAEEWLKPEYAEQEANTARIESNPREAGCLERCAEGYLVRYLTSGQMCDLQKSIQSARRLVDISTEDDPRRAEFLLKLSHTLELRGQELHSFADSLRAKAIAEDALAITPEDHPDRADRLSSLGTTQFNFHSQFGTLSDLENSIENMQSAVSISLRKRSDCGSHCRMISCYHIYLLQLGVVIGARFSFTGQLSDFEHSVVYIEEVESRISGSEVNSHTKAHCLGLLAGAYRQRYSVRLRIADLDQAIQIYRLSASIVSSDDSYRRGTYMSLADTLWERYKISGCIDDIDGAIEHCKDVLLKSTGNIGRSTGCFQHLGMFYETKFFRTQQITDIGQSVQSFQQALELIEPDITDPEYHRVQVGIGTSSSLLYKESRAEEDLDRSNLALYKVANFSIGLPPQLAFDAAVYLIWNHVETKSWSSAAGQIDLLLEMLPKVILPSSSRDDLQFFLRKTWHIFPLMPVAYLNGGGSSSAALGVLESCRGMILNLILNGRSEVSMLQEEQPDLWAEYIHCRDQISRLKLDIIPVFQVDATQSYAAKTHMRQKLYDNLQEVQTKIRQCPGHERFLLPPKGKEITDLATNGPLVCFNIYEGVSLAFLVTSTGVEVLPITKFDGKYMAQMLNLSNPRRYRAKRDVEIIDSDDDENITTQGSEYLEHLWINAVKPVLQKLGLLRKANSPSTKLPRIWWIGGGIMSLLPLGAAGIHTPGSMENTSSHVVSSYVPSLKMLQFLRNKLPLSLPPSAEERRLLVVSMPTTPGIYGSLNTMGEVAAIKAHTAGLAQFTHMTQPSKSDVSNSLRSCTLAHFACHGSVNSEEPMKSSLILGNDTEERLSIGEIIDAIASKRARIAYLSACSTAEIKTNILVNEAIHLASAFQLAGFQHVVGTLWKADDSAAVAIASKFYELLFQEEKITDSTVAYALHDAVLDYRNCNGGGVLKWASFIHMGC